MDVAAFLQALLDALAGHAFVESVDVQTEAIVARGRIQLEGDRFLQIYFNEETGTTAYYSANRGYARRDLKIQGRSLRPDGCRERSRPEEGGLARKISRLGICVPF